MKDRLTPLISSINFTLHLRIRFIAVVEKAVAGKFINKAMRE
jgi:hypothetical protein